MTDKETTEGKTDVVKKKLEEKLKVQTAIGGIVVSISTIAISAALSSIYSVIQSPGQYDILTLINIFGSVIILFFLDSAFVFLYYMCRWAETIIVGEELKREREKRLLNPETLKDQLNIALTQINAIMKKMNGKDEIEKSLTQV